MRRGRGGAAKKKRPPALEEEVRKSRNPVVVICLSDWTRHTESFCSKTNQWQVVVYTADTNKWWDRLASNSRIRHGPPTAAAAAAAANKGQQQLLCHAIVVYDPNHDEQYDTAVHKAAKLLGESVELATVALLYAPPAAKEELETATTMDTVLLTLDNNLNLDSPSSYKALRQLWALQDAHDQDNAAQEASRLQFHQVPQVCQGWSSLRWRWNGPRLRNLYQRLVVQSQSSTRVADDVENDYNNKEEDVKIMASEADATTEMIIEERFHYYKLRRQLEEKAALLLKDPETQRVADFILSGGDEENNLDFGRLHAWAHDKATATIATRGNTKYLLVASNNKEDTILNAYDYATCHCMTALEQLKMVSERPSKDQFCIPVTANAMITVRLIPALFPKGVKYQGADIANQFDVVLGSRRAWPEHMALKTCIIYLFQGQPGSLWDLSMRVVKSALPKTWNLLLHEPPDEAFLRALLHPDVIEAGRLLRLDENKQPLLPAHLQPMARIYALGRFVRTLDTPTILVKNEAIRREVASTMKVTPEQVDAIVRHANKTKLAAPLSLEECADIFLLQPSNSPPAAPGEEKRESSAAEGLTQDTMEVLGMLGLFLNRDRKSLRDSNLIEAPTFEVQTTYKTTKALADCAMFCGAIRWLSQDDADEDGIWTCRPCLHRWQKRGQAREAFQTRKLMHPMTLTPFTRDEYYNKEEWDRIMEATNGNISRLGIDFYWGTCSTQGCGRVCQAVARSGACAETDGVPLDDFPETVVLNEGYGDTIQLRHSLEILGHLGVNNMVTTESLEKFFDSEEKLMYLPGPVRRRVRNCIDKSTYILPRGLLCDQCGAVPEGSIDEYCPYCGTGFEPVFACVHYSCPQCRKHFCKACLGIDGMHFNGVYSARDHVCWRTLGNNYSYHNKGVCAKCRKERPWPKSHALVSAGPEIRRKALAYTDGEGMPLEMAIEMQSSNLKVFTERYKEGVTIFENCSHTVGLGPNYCHCGADVTADDDEEDEDDYF